MLSIEGGPGYPTAADRDSRAALWAPLSQRRALLLVDLRGTGRSDALSCPAFAKTTVDYIERAGRCADELGPRRDYYGTGDAVEDLEDVLLAIRAGPVDLYGDSYGTYAAQAFALRHPERLRSLTLDAAYPLPGTDPAYADLIAAFRRGLRLSCQRRPGCPAARAARGRGRADRRGCATSSRRSRSAGSGSTATATCGCCASTQDGLAQIAGASYYSYVVWRDLLAAVVAYEEGDDAPLLRLGAEHIYGDAGAADPPSFSDPLYLAVTCHDYPQLWDPDTPIALRAEEAAARLGGYPAGHVLPVHGRGVDLARVRRPTRLHEVAEPGGEVSRPSRPTRATREVPTLVLNGDLDTITASSGAKVVAEKFPRSWFVEVSNSIHVTALGDRDSCASVIYVNFVRELRPGDTSCAAKVPEIRVVPRFATDGRPRSMPDRPSRETRRPGHIARSPSRPPTPLPTSSRAGG